MFLSVSACLVLLDNNLFYRLPIRLLYFLFSFTENGSCIYIYSFLYVTIFIPFWTKKKRKENLVAKRENVWPKNDIYCTAVLQGRL